MMIDVELLELLWPILLGAALSGLTGWIFWRLGSKDLRESTAALKAATDDLRRLQVITMRALEGKGSAIDEFARDTEGNFTGISHPLEAHGAIRFNATATGLSSSTKTKESADDPRLSD